MDEWLTKEGITFEPSAPYSQEQNGVSERVGRTIMDMTRATILEGNINDELWPEIVLAMTYVKNVRPTKALQESNLYQAQHQKSPDISHLRVLGSTVYVFIHEEEPNLKSEKWEPRATRGVLVGYDGHTIYRVHVENHNKVIRVKDLQVLEESEAKTSTALPNYEDTPTFQGFLLVDDDVQSPEPENLVPGTCQADVPAFTSRSGRKVKPTSKARAAENATHRLSRKGKDAERVEQSHAGQKAKNTHDASDALDVEQSHAGPPDVSTTSRADQEFEDADEQTKSRAGIGARRYAENERSESRASLETRRYAEKTTNTSAVPKASDAEATPHRPVDPTLGAGLEPK